MVLVGFPGPIGGALVEGPTELDSLEQPARSTRGAKSRNIRTIGSFLCNILFVRNMTDQWLYCSDLLACIAGGGSGWRSPVYHLASLVKTRFPTANHSAGKSFDGLVFDENLPFIDFSE
jgi:hypothetical protein